MHRSERPALHSVHTGTETSRFQGLHGREAVGTLQDTVLRGSANRKEVMMSLDDMALPWGSGLM